MRNLDTLKEILQKFPVKEIHFYPTGVIKSVVMPDLIQVNQTVPIPDVLPTEPLVPIPDEPIDQEHLADDFDKYFKVGE